MKIENVSSGAHLIPLTLKSVTISGRLQDKSDKETNQNAEFLERTSGKNKAIVIFL